MSSWPCASKHGPGPEDWTEKIRELHCSTLAPYDIDFSYEKERKKSPKGICT
jgi:hypothetical protein